MWPFKKTNVEVFSEVTPENEQTPPAAMSPVVFIQTAPWFQRLSAFVNPVSIPHCNHWKVLVVDDNSLCRRQIMKVIHEDGHFVDECGDGFDAIYKVKFADEHLGNPYDCIVMSDDLPFLCGGDIARVLRAKGYDKLILIGLTKSLNEEHLQTYRVCGADIVMRKPLLIDGWRRIRHSLLGGSGKTVHFS
jgi:CheY-like chemotaxis protein